MPAAAFYAADIRSPEVSAVFDRERPDYVIHQAAQISVAKSVADPGEDAAVNIQGTLNILANCRRCGVRKIVFASSAAVYGEPEALPIGEDHPCRPQSPYGITKLAAEQYLAVYAANYALPYTALRYANVYGPRQVRSGEGGVVTIFIDALLAGEDLVLHGDGGQTRDFIYVADVARANLAALRGGDNRICNISGGEETGIRELAQTLSELAGIPAVLRRGESRPGDLRRSSLANTRAKKELGWAPQVALADGLASTIAYFRGTGGGADAAR